ncbi:nuclear transport factor 2 family protein [Amycolatopsis sp., V23-08]|uniref:Nuclear transport factor 2 family protein n=1 Tax=Amycolatopsis heterodermiae TaxID=3110235 RepID=A0ABU5R8Z3_9PSEU|nr:nuclear transport factor 2 family protein [Amycolatopsis sp., V23-08]MEA5362683.1 nuclear transport factor 2 family protein [Amycolatopsis sp., V23-08]
MDLVVLEEIRRLKYRYLRGVDLKQWDEVADTFTVDATADYGTRATGREGHQLAGRDAILEFLTKSLGNGIITVHHAGQPEIDVDGDTATGRWSFTDKVIVPDHKVIIDGAAFYEDTYRRDTDGAWRMTHIGYTRTYESMTSWEGNPGFRLLANRWAVPA